MVLAGQKAQKSTYEVVATTETDENGNFYFFSIDDGFYYIWVDIPGLPVEEVYYIEVTGQQFISSIDYLITEETVVGGKMLTSYTDLINDPEISIYPNPASDLLTIELHNSSIGICDLYDSKGMLIEHTRLVSQSQVIDISKYTPGNYIIRIMTDDIIVFRMINIIR
ncbi:hypothetical protein ES708_35267 [subsurface metagenome]